MVVWRLSGTKTGHFIPHTNDSLLAFGLMLEDVNLENGPLQVIPGSHKGPVLSHHQ